jgi:hypothetical protein
MEARYGGIRGGVLIGEQPPDEIHIRAVFDWEMYAKESRLTTVPLMYVELSSRSIQIYDHVQG